MGRFFKRSDSTIDLRPSAVEARPVWGRPTRCPNCGGRGYLDQLDLNAGVMLQHCPDCWHEWQTPEAETVPA
jgi:hypothetical protein